MAQRYHNGGGNIQGYLMPQYRIKILNKSGGLEEFDRDYPDAESLEADIKLQGRLLVEFREKGESSLSITRFRSRLKRILGPGKIDDEDIYNLFYELGIILKSGAPIIRALNMVAAENLKPSLKNLISETTFQLKEGKDLSSALESRPVKDLYDFKTMVPIIKMGEKTGRLGESCLKIAANLENWLRIKGEITNALIYPLLLIGTSLIAVYVMLVYVIPRFVDIVQKFKVALPFYTRFLFKVGVFFNRHQNVFLLTLILFLSLLLVLSRRLSFRRRISSLAYKAPVVRKIRFSSETVRFLNSLANLLSGGVPILLALDLASDSFTSPVIRDKLRQAGLSLRKGELLADALKSTALFPEIIPNMIRVGEESGTLPGVLTELHKLISERFLKRIKRYVNILEPLVILFIAVFIGMVIMAILPIIMNLGDFNF